MKRSYKVRFNLGKGKNYMKWKIEGPDGVNYYNPSEVQIVMTDCQLKNQIKTAEKILDGAHKTVCAWVRCVNVEIKQPSTEPRLTQLKYNPRVRPYWCINDLNADNMLIEQVLSSDRKLFISSK